MKRSITLALAALLSAGCSNAKVHRVYFGMSKAKGVYTAEFDAEIGKLSHPVLAVEAQGVGFVVAHPNGKWLYSTKPAAYEINADGSLRELNAPDSPTDGPCHITLDATGRTALIAYYRGGGAASFAIQPDGSLSEAVSFHEHEGSGEHPKRQQKPHGHSIYPNPANTHAYVCDLGIDKVMIYALDPAKGAITPSGEAIVPGGSMGPRHMKFNADGSIAYVLNELDMSVSVFDAASDGSLSFVKTVSTFPADFDKSEMTCAEIRVHPNGKFVYASNRDLAGKGRDAITVFTRAEDGLERLAVTPAEIWFPRNFNLDPSGEWMLVGGQRSNDLAIFKVDPESGLIQFTGDKIPFEGGPICVEFID